MGKLDNQKQAQSDRTRRCLIQAATVLILRNGYSATTLSKLANEVGMTKGAIYHHFATKEAVLRAVIEHVRSSWEQQVGARIPAEGDALERLGALFDHQAKLINSDPSLCLLINGLLLESEAINHEMMAEIRRIYSDFAELVGAIVAGGQEQGTIRTDLQADALARSIVAIIKGISCSREADPSDSSFSEKMLTTKMIVLAGVRR